MHSSTSPAPAGSSLIDGDRRDLHRQYADRIQLVSVQYDQRIKSLADTLTHTLNQFQHDSISHVLQRDSLTSNLVRDRLSEVLIHATRDERERLLKETLRIVAEQDCTIKQLQAKLQQALHSHNSSSFESNHRSSLTLTQANSSVTRMEGEIRDIKRDLDISKQTEIVYREQLHTLQLHSNAQLAKYEQLSKENSDLKLRARNTEEQNALLKEHAKERDLITELADKRWKQKFSVRENQLQTEVNQLRSELDSNKVKSNSILDKEISVLKVTSSHETIVALNELKGEYEERIRRLDTDWSGRLHNLEIEMRTLEKSTAEDIASNTRMFEQERQTLVDSNRSHMEHTLKTHQSHITDIQQTHQLELQQLQERIQHLLSLQHKVVEEKNQVVQQHVVEQLQTDKQFEVRVTELQAQNRSLTDQVGNLQNQLSIAQAVKDQMDRSNDVYQEEWKLLTQRYNDVVMKYQSISSSSQHNSSSLHQVTHERDVLKEKYLNLGEKLEKMISSVEGSMSHTADSERQKRDALKQQYSTERHKWKSEKHALLETISLQEKKILDLTNLVKTLEDKIEETQKYIDSIKENQDKERHANTTTITQLQQDIHTLQSHRKSIETDLSEKLHHIDKLMLEKNHVVDYQMNATQTANLSKESNINSLEHEFNLRSNNMKHDLESSRKEMELNCHKLKMENEKEKTQLWKEAQIQMDQKMEEIKNTMFSKEQIELQVKLKVDERVASISKTLLHPHQHDQILASKLESLRAKMSLEAQVALQDLANKHTQSMHNLENQHNFQLDELKLKYENEYSIYVDGMKATMKEMEDKLKDEKKEALEWIKIKQKFEQDIRNLQSELHEHEVRIENHQLNEKRFLSHLSSQSNVIEKLKEILNEEKQRIADMPSHERRRLVEQMEEESRRFSVERSNLVRNQQEQVANLQSLLDAEKNLIRQLNEERDEREREHRAREDKIQSDHRLSLEDLLSRSTAQISSIESTHRNLWQSREINWLSEQNEREKIVEQKINGWEENYKRELAAREYKIKTLLGEMQACKVRNENLEDELENLQKQLRDTAKVLETQTAKMTRAGAQIRQQNEI